MGETHPVFQSIFEAHGLRPAPTHRGWAISFEYGYFNAYGPDYDCSWEGEEDGWVSNGHHVTARTREGLIEEIDAWFDENDPTPPSDKMEG